MGKIDEAAALNASKHKRLSERRRLVYPVFSRRAGGLSLGININPDKKCDFNCVYCQVDKSQTVAELSPNIPQIVEELEEWLSRIAEEDSDSAWKLKDIAVAGDGEPSSVGFLPELLRKIIKLKAGLAQDECKIVLFSNGSRLDRPDLAEVWPKFFAADGEIWLKLDFWDEQSLKKINRTNLSAEKLLENIINLGRQYPLVFQSCFFCWDREKLGEDACRGYIKLVRRLLKRGVKIKLIQAYTLARTPGDRRAAPWSDQEMDRIARILKDNLPVEIQTFYQNGK